MYLLQVIFPLLVLPVGVSSINVVLLQKTLFAFENALYFFEKDYDQVNFDALFGLKVAQGTLGEILSNVDINNKPVLLNYYIKEIKMMYETADKTLAKALPHIRRNYAEIYRQFYKLVEKPWRHFHPFRRIQETVFSRKLKNVTFDGPTSDKCIHLLLKDSNGSERSSCKITHDCWRYETQKGMDGYTANHQVLYFLIGLRENCGDNFQKWFKLTARKARVNDLLSELCSNIKHSYKQGMNSEDTMSEQRKDLRMEQALVCTIAGYEDFFSETDLNIVLGWQTRRGCYGYEDQIQNKRLQLGRRLLNEKKLSDGCLAHETGVGIALLAQYLRWIFENIHL